MFGYLNIKQGTGGKKQKTWTSKEKARPRRAGGLGTKQPRGRAAWAVICDSVLAQGQISS